MAKTPQHHSPKTRSISISGLGGNEAFCLSLVDLRPGHLLVGNSVQSIGVLGNISAGLRNLAGGESVDVTEAIKRGRDAALHRMEIEAKQVEATGVSGVASELRPFAGQIEFLSTGSAVHGPEPTRTFFTSSFDGKELFCAMDAGYSPRRFVFGNIAYSIGAGGGLLGALKSFGRGEIREYSSVLNATRHAALQRIVHEAQATGANVVLGIQIEVMPVSGFHEMLMTGTAAFHPALTGYKTPGSCELTCDELWSLTKMGYAPIRVVMGTAVYSLGIKGGVMAALRGMKRGEVPGLTSMVYDAREHVLDLIEAEAKMCGADCVMGTDLFIQELSNGLVEFMAVGTAVRRMDSLSTDSDALPAQAVAQHRRTFWQSSDPLLVGGLPEE